MASMAARETRSTLTGLDTGFVRVNELTSGLQRKDLVILAARPSDVPGDDYGERATQWFVMSDFGLTAYSGSDGIHAFVNSLATTEPIPGTEVRLIARNNEVLGSTAPWLATVIVALSAFGATARAGLSSI